MIGVCITTYNEEQSIGPLIQAFLSRGPSDYKIFVVDDRSDDLTVPNAMIAGATIASTMSKRKGIGPCMLACWQLALNAGCDTVIQIDAGGSHFPYDSIAMLSKLESADMVIGSRFLQPHSYIGGTKRRRFLSKAATAMLNRVQYGARWTDWTSGYRVFSRKAIELLITKPYFATMHGWQIQVLAYAGEMGLRIVESPIIYRAGRSSFNKKVAWEAFRVWTDIAHHVGPIGSRIYGKE